MTLNGCGAERHRRAEATAAIVVSRACMVSIELTDEAECSGADLKHLVCTGLLLTKKADCETLRIER